MINLQNVTAAEKAAFLSTLIVGYMVHLFAFTNLIPNCDGLSRLYDRQNMLMSGRWFLHAASLFHGFTESPALIGALSLFFLSVSAVLIVDLFEIKSIGGAILTGGFLSGNLILAYTYTFIFTASAYAFAILLAVLSVWLTCRIRKSGWLAGAITLAFSVGIYQSYLALALSLAVIAFILNLSGSADKRAKKKPWILFLRFVLLFGLGTGLYLVILYASLRIEGIQLSNYRSMNTFSLDLSPAGIFSMFRSVFSDFREFLFSGTFIRLHARCWMILNGLFLISGVTGLIRLIRIRRLYRKPKAMLWLLAALAFFPFALNFTSFLNKSSLWMRYSFIGYDLFPVAIWERCGRKRRTPALLAGLCAFMILFQAQYSNAVYTALKTAHTATQSFLTTLVARIQGTSGYRSDMDVIIIGTPSSDLYQNGVPELQLISTTASPVNSVLYETKHVYYYLNDWMNIAWQEPSEETFKEVSDSREFQEMPVYPDDGSIKISGDTVLVRLSESYTPKKQFELDFEKTQQNQ